MRSPYAHARINSIEKTDALKSRDVVAILTAEDFIKLTKAGCQMFPLPPQGSSEWVRGVKAVWKYPIAVNKTRYVGECVALVVNKNPYNLFDAVDKVNVYYEPLKPIVSVEQALKGDVLVYDELKDNIAMKYSFRNTSTLNA